MYKLTHNIFIAVKFQIYFVGLKNQVFVRLMTISASLKYICMGSPPLSVYIYISNIVSEFLQLFILRAVGESAPSSHHHISTVHTHWGTCSRLYYLCHLCEMQMSRDFCEIKCTANFFKLYPAASLVNDAKRKSISVGPKQDNNNLAFFYRNLQYSILSIICEKSNHPIPQVVDPYTRPSGPFILA